ncbi:hypothetical protein ACFE04_026417 [Oxalis oulophora]
MSKPKAEKMSKSSRSTWNLILFLFLVVPVVVATLFYKLDSLDPAPLPLHELSPIPIRAPLINDNMLQGAELLGVGILKGPEDLAYDHNSGVIYTGCEDGWIKRLELTQGTVENWVNTGGRPLGLALGLNHDQLIVADTDKV